MCRKNLLEYKPPKMIIFNYSRIVYLNALNMYLFPDVETKRWNFELSEHDKLVAALAPLRPAVCISPLPSFVRRVSSRLLLCGHIVLFIHQPYTKTLYI